MSEDEIAGWHHQLDGHEFEQALGDGDEQGSLACCSPWGREELDTTGRLNSNIRYVLSQVVLAVKILPANAGDIRDAGWIPGSGRSPGGEHGNPLQYSCLENPMDRGAWWAAV